MRTRLPRTVTLLAVAAFSCTTQESEPDAETVLEVTTAVPVTATTDQAAFLEDDDPVDAANKQLVYDFQRIVVSAGHVDEVVNFVSEDYVQHNPNIDTGRAAFMRELKIWYPEPLEVQDTIPTMVSLVADAGLVVLAQVTTYDAPSLPAGEYTSTWFDMYRVEDGVIVEHWDEDTRGALCSSPR